MRIGKAYGKGKFFGAIKWLPLIPGSSFATERYPNFLLSHFPPLAQGPSNFNSGAHAAFLVTSRSVFFCGSVWMSSSTVSSAIRGTGRGLHSVEVQEWSQKEVRNLLQ